MKMIIAFFCCVVIAAICLECVRNKDYEDEIVGRIALWVIFFACLGRSTQVVDGWLAPYVGGGTLIAAGIGLDNVEMVLWVGLLLFFSRHYYRFRHWRHSGKFAWRKSEKAAG